MIELLDGGEEGVQVDVQDRTSIPRSVLAGV